MTGQEFLQRLEMALASLTDSQKQEVMAYFKEYLAEAGDNAEAIAELGHPEEVAKELVGQFQEKGILEERAQELTVRESLADVTTLQITLHDFDVIVEQDDVSEVVIEAVEEVKELLAISRENGKVTIAQTSDTARYKTISILGLFSVKTRMASGVTVKVPRSTSFKTVTVTSRDGDATLSGVTANQAVVTLTNGDLELKDCRIADLKMTLQNGDGEVIHSTMENVLGNLQNGDCEIAECQLGVAEFYLANGDLELEKVESHETLELQLSNGDLIYRHGKADHARAKLSNGDATVSDLDFKDLMLTHHCGDAAVSLKDGQAEDLAIVVETKFGDYRVLGHSGENGRYTHINHQATRQLTITNHFGDVSVN
ncbi:DUF4097 family beta strand repeat-containing protein [Streptococcus hillyeri]|uniref:DUF4097 domain-containing protein n=1 Tax=Streptococcus hillyeri TaxID=2282420 RepID=A0A3L9DRE9_9STRE|nr:DUF4097 family beta strand repeat-containing protein [Streptococcus hillyeri]RLY02798.1 hypothetical protein EAF07_06805 [Streptococcus hillyeri]